MPWRTIDRLLEELPRLRALADQLLPRSTDIVRYKPPGSRTGGSQVEVAALRRAELTAVLDVVDAVLRALPRDLRRLAHKRYRERWWRAKLRAEFHISEATLKRRLNTIRRRVWEAVQALPATTRAAFWTHLFADRPRARQAPPDDPGAAAVVVAVARDPEGREIQLVRTRQEGSHAEPR